MPEGLRIYNLFPLLAGAIPRWHDHLPRIAAMGFNWIYLNPFHYPGFSGSLYAVKDYGRLHPLFQGDSGAAPDALLTSFVEAARSHGLRVMMDLVINHTSKDALLVSEHPEWYLRNADGTVRSPGAIDPQDPSKFTEWGDLAEMDFHNGATRPAIVDYFGGVACHYARLGFAGFRCDAAYKVPAEVWAAVIGKVREVDSRSLFAAETLGCKVEEVAALHGAGFDWLFNSAKWWDFRSDWLFEQYDALRRIAPSIAFPESHDTDRLVAELGADGDVEAHYRLRALFAAFFSAGWMMPMGYEYGFARRLDVVRTRPEDWEEARFDLTGFLADLNRMKAETPALLEEGAQIRLTGPNAPVLALLRRSRDGADCALAVADLGARPVEVDLAGLLAKAEGPAPRRWADLTPGAAGEVGDRLHLAPVEMRILGGRVRAAPTVAGGREAEMERLGSRSILIEDVRPQVDCGRFPVKREVGDVLEVSADIFKDGHDRLAAVVRFREADASGWRETPMVPTDNDRWGGRFRLERNTRYVFTIEAWADAFESWWDDTAKKRQAGQAVTVELHEGRALVEAALGRAGAADRERLRRILADCDAADRDDDRADLLRSSMLRQIMARHPDRSRAVLYDRELEVVADRVIARFAAWYEMMPRSQASDPSRSATFADCERRLPYIRDLGFDVVYLLPIHPIGRVHRKGPNNTLLAGPDDPGSPYAIGSAEGGHKAVHPDLGTIEDFRRFVRAARETGLEVALDFAIQCAPDHPYVREHPEWFQWRPDGTIRYAENPPKKYQDIVNVNFHGPHVRALWKEMLDVVMFWIGHGVTIFRVDNPHTKPVPFWEWLIRGVQDRHPEIVFLAEAFTRPKMMRMLAKAGFSQSYTYFTWRNFKQELTDYVNELAQSEAREYFRPNFFPATPDILPPFLQTGGRPAFRIRLILAATLSSVYGLYNGYELCENRALPGKEEYLDSEKYQYKVWDWDRPGNIRDDIARINAIRRANPALQEFENTRFHPADDDNVLFYGKITLDRGNMIFVAVNLDPFDAHDAVLHFPLRDMGVPDGETFEVEELLTGAHHLWRGEAHRIRLDPQVNPAAIYRVTVWTSVGYRTPCF